jgi:hypothetical protein
MVEFTVTNDDGEDITHELPSRFEVCSRCDGHGTHLTPSIGEYAYSEEEFNEAFDDDEDREAYFERGGKYDVRCETCHGKRVEEVVDEETCPADLLKKYQKYQQDKHYHELECAAERAMGA